jgi:RNAse (barnase) inhibitor barstar
MAIWDPEDELTHPVDFLLVQNGFINVFFRREILDESVSWLQHAGYRIVRVDAAAWLVEADLHADIASTLNFPDYYGANMNALRDCLSDVAVQDYGWTETDAGLVLVIEGFDDFAARHERTAHQLLDIYARSATHAALFGNRLMCLVKSGHPNLRIRDVGAQRVSWNYREFQDSSRQDG